MKKIVVGVDGSEPSTAAAEFASRIAERFGAELLVACAVQPLLPPAEIYGPGLAELQKSQETEAHGIVEAAAAKLRRPGLTTSTRVVLGGSPAERLAAMADEERADLVVVGSRGRGAVARVLLGSISDRLVHICKRPVLVVR